MTCSLQNKISSSNPFLVSWDQLSFRRSSLECRACAGRPCQIPKKVQERQRCRHIHCRSLLLSVFPMLWSKLFLQSTFTYNNFEMFLPIGDKVYKQVSCCEDSATILWYNQEDSKWRFSDPKVSTTKNAKSYSSFHVLRNMLRGVMSVLRIVKRNFRVFLSLRTTLKMQLKSSGLQKISQETSNQWNIVG